MLKRIIVQKVVLPDLPPTYSQLDLASSPPSYSSPASYSSPPSYGPDLEVCSYCIRGLHLCVPPLTLDAFLHPLHFLSDPPSLIHRHPIIQCLPWQIYKARVKSTWLQMVVVAPPPSYQSGLDYEALVLSIDEISTKWEQMRVKWEWKWKWSEDKSCWLMRPVLYKCVRWNRYFWWKSKKI